MGNEKRVKNHGGSVLFGAPATSYPASSWCSGCTAGVYPGCIQGVYTGMYTVCGNRVDSGRLEQRKGVKAV